MSEITIILLMALPISLCVCILAYAKPLWILILLVYSLLLSQSFPLTYIGDRPLNISSDHILIPLLIGVSVLRYQKLLGPGVRHVVFPYLIFSGWAVLTLVISILVSGLSANFPALVETSKWFLYSLILIPCLILIRTPRMAQRVLRHLCVATVLVLLIGYVQWALLPNRGSGNIVSTFGSIARNDIITAKNSLAVFLTMSLMVFTALFIRRQVGTAWGIIIFSLLSVIILWSFSRSAFIGVIVGFFWLFITRTTLIGRITRGFISIRIISLWFGLSVILIATILYSATQGFSLNTPVARIIGLFGDPDTNFAAAGLSARVAVLIKGLDVLLQSPVWGYGFFARYIRHPELTIVDNFYLDVALDTGVWGLILMIWLFVGLVRTVLVVRDISVRQNSRLLEAWAWGTSAALIVLFLASVSASFFYVGRILGTLMITIGCLIKWAHSSECSDPRLLERKTEIVTE